MLKKLHIPVSRSFYTWLYVIPTPYLSNTHVHRHRHTHTHSHTPSMHARTHTNSTPQSKTHKQKPKSGPCVARNLPSFSLPPAPPLPPSDSIRQSIFSCCWRSQVRPCVAATNAPCPTGDCRSHRVSQRPSIATESFSVNYGKCLPKLQKSKNWRRRRRRPPRVHLQRRHCHQICMIRMEPSSKSALIMMEPSPVRITWIESIVDSLKRKRSSDSALMIVTRAVQKRWWSRDWTLFHYDIYRDSCRMAMRLTQNNSVTMMQTMQRNPLMQNHTILIQRDQALSLCLSVIDEAKCTLSEWSHVHYLSGNWWTGTSFRNKNGMEAEKDQQFLLFLFCQHLFSKRRQMKQQAAIRLLQVYQVGLSNKFFRPL